MESSVERTSQEGAGYTFNSAGGAYRHGVARPFKDKIRVAEIYLEMREIDPDVSIRAASLAASVGKKFATKVVSEVKKWCFDQSSFAGKILRPGGWIFDHIVQRWFVTFSALG
jgi:hypothetical protein